MITSLITLNRFSAIIALLVLLVNLLAVSDSRADTRDEQARLQKELQLTAKEQAQAEKELAIAREALNRSRYEDAANRFARAYEILHLKREAGDALYWEAFSRYRLDRTRELKRAIALLEKQEAEYPESATAEEGQALIAQVYAELAERGEAEAAREIATRATEEELRQETRSAALQALMQMNPRKAKPILRKIVLDDSPGNLELRRNALFIMCQQGDEQAEDLLIELLQKEQNPEFLSEIVMCLSMTGSQRALDALMEVFRRTEDPEVSEAALMSIGQHGGDEVFEFLAQVLADNSRPTQIRAQAIMALGMFRPEEDVADILIDILDKESDREILEMAIMALSHVDTPRAQEALMELVTRQDTDEDLRGAALHFATASGSVDLELLRRVYGQAESRDMKQQVCHALTLMDDEDAALDLLIEITKQETDPVIKRDAVFWIGQFDNERAADYLLEVINQGQD